MTAIGRSCAGRAFLIFSMVCMLAIANSALAFPVFVGPSPVIEFYNLQTGHYFMTIDATEAAGIDAGNAGPGWVRTGYVFYAQPTGLLAGPCQVNCGQPVSRFYGPSPNSHFYTIGTAEAEFLKRPGSGWLFEGTAFASIPVDPATGGCGLYRPVYRLYNNRFAFNDSNHRFVTNQQERERMIAKGWADEGISFCTTGVEEAAIKSFRFEANLDDGKIQPSAVCEDESRSLGACMAVNNLAAPTTRIASSGLMTPPMDYGLKTGMSSNSTFIAGPLPDPVAATTVFVQQSSNAYGIHVDTVQRGPSVLTSVNPLYQFKTTVEPGAADARVFPFSHAYETDAQISVKFVANVRTVTVRNAASQAFGHPTLELIDQRSGRHLYFTTLVYGTVEPNDYLAPDIGTGKVIVGTTFRDGSPYLRNFDSWTFATPSGFVAENVWGRGGKFEYRMDRGEFQRVLDAARTIDGALSADPADYMLDNFHFNNEVYGDGEIGMNLTGFRLELVRR
jgi:hypothetical protein